MLCWNFGLIYVDVEFPLILLETLPLVLALAPKLPSSTVDVSITYMLQSRGPAAAEARLCESV